MQLQPGDAAAGTTLTVFKHRGIASAVVSNLRSALQGHRKKDLLKAVVEPDGSGTLHKTHARMNIFRVSFPRPIQYTCNTSQLKWYA